MTVRILHGDCRDMLAQLPEQSVHCVVTSPPYWGLRDYSLQPSVWGAQPGCDHEWVAVGGRTRKTGGTSSSTLGERHHDNSVSIADVEAKVAARTVEVSRGEVCDRCDAWRGCLGLEPSPARYVANMLEVFRAVWRVLRDDGTAWVNIGDTYATSGGSGWQGKHGSRADRTHSQRNLKARSALPEFGLKPKDLCMIPAQVALALRSDGWYLRRDIIWHKPNPMPESVDDRPMTAHEYVYLLSKSERYYYDGDAIREPLADDTAARYQRAHNGYAPPGQDEHRGILAPRPNTKPVPAGWDFGEGRHGSIHRDGRTMKELPEGQSNLRKRRDAERGRAGISAPGFDEKKWQELEDPQRLTRPPMTMEDREYHPLGRTKRSVWTIPTSPFAKAHFATFPPKLVEPCILAGTSSKGCCPKCMAGWVRKIEKVFVPQDDVDQEKGVRGAGEQKPMDASNSWQGYPRGTVAGNVTEQAWHPSCECDGVWLEQLHDVTIVEGRWVWITRPAWFSTGDVSKPVPAVVLDIFGGAATTGLVADRLGRDAVMCEASGEYVEMGRDRIAGEAGMFADVVVKRPQDCQTGMADICRAGRRDGVVCPEESCDIDDGIRA